MPRKHKQPLPDAMYGGPFDPAISSLASLVALITAPIGATRPQAEGLGQSLMAQLIAAQTWGDPATWDDCKRNLAGTLRVLLAALEGA